MDGQDRGDARAQRQRVLVVGERAAGAAGARRGRRHAIRHSWESAASSIGSTPSGMSAGFRVTAAKRRSGAARGKLAQEVPDVGLVAGALAAEDVGVEQDVDHAAASR